MFRLTLVAPLRRMKKEPLFSIHYFFLQKYLLSGKLQLPSTPLGLKRYFLPPWGGSIRLDHLFQPSPPNDSDIPTLLHRSSGSISSPDISFAPSSLSPSLAPRMCFKIWMLITYQFFYLSFSLRKFALTNDSNS